MLLQAEQTEKLTSISLNWSKLSFLVKTVVILSVAQLVTTDNVLFTLNQTTLLSVFMNILIKN